MSEISISGAISSLGVGVRGRLFAPDQAVPSTNDPNAFITDSIKIDQYAQRIAQLPANIAQNDDEADTQAEEELVSTAIDTRQQLGFVGLKLDKRAAQSILQLLGQGA